MLGLFKEILLEDNVLPRSTNEAKKIVCTLELEVEKIHACVNDCILYRGEYEDFHACPTCKHA